MATTITRTVTRALYRKEPLTDGRPGWRAVEDGFEEGLIQLTVDLDMLATVIGGQALKNRTGKSHIASGMVKARVINRKRISQ